MLNLQRQVIFPTTQVSIYPFSTPKQTHITSMHNSPKQNNRQLVPGTSVVDCQKLKI